MMKEKGWMYNAGESSDRFVQIRCLGGIARDVGIATQGMAWHGIWAFPDMIERIGKSSESALATY